MNNDVLLVLTAFAAGAVASVSGFGIGSILTPLLAAWLGTKMAVAVVSLPHFIGTLLRFVLLREHLDKRVLMTFGVTSAAGGLMGALLQAQLRSAVLAYVLGALLMFAGLMGVTGWGERLRFSGRAGWIAGFLSGIFGGLVGNQGGIRSAAMLGFRVSKESFIATATAIGLVVDLFRMPVYVATQHQEILSVWRLVLVATIGVVIGTVVGKPLLTRIPERAYRAMVSLLILGLGIWMLLHLNLRT